MIRNCGKKIFACVLACTMMLGSFGTVDYVEAAAKAKLTTKKLTITKGSKKTIKIKRKSSKCKYTYKSKNKKIAKVSSKGVVTAVKKGTTKITVKEINKSNKKSKTLGTVKVTVKSKQKVTETPASVATQAPIVTATPGAVIVPTPTPTPAPTACLDIDFADGDMSKFKPEGDGVKLEMTVDGYDDAACLKATNRTNRHDWFGCGMAIDVSKVIKPATTYKVTCYVKCDTDATITLRSTNGSGAGWGNFPSQVGETVSVKANQWTLFEAVYASPDAINGSVTLYWDASTTADMYIDNIHMIEHQILDGTFKALFSEIFGKVGTCNTYTQMKNNKSFTTTLYNSVTMENEMKPQSILNEGNISNTPPEGYIIPDSYIDRNYPVLNFDTIDNVIQTAYEYGFTIRFHVLVWHSQTPEFFFKNGYNRNSGFVSQTYMEGRLEYYVRNVIQHIYNTPHGKDVVNCIDVVNEYFHNYDQGSKSMWNTIYYPGEKSEEDRTNKPLYVKNAFMYAYDELSKFDLNGKVKLFYNDYNTYEVYDDIVTMINYINEDGKICDGVGMQSHLDVDYPQPGMTGKIATTIDTFAENGYEIQITELDVTDYDNSGKQTDYYCELIDMIIKKKKAGANITSITFWGLCDSNSWRRSGKPLLFSAIFSPKDVFYKVIEAAKKAWY